jgi:uncharacterized membrane protein YidH (DUF202 family)
MVNNIFFTIVFFILDHFILVFICNAIGMIIMNYAYKKWHDTSIASDIRFMYLIILILLAIMLIIFLLSIIYVMSIFIVYFHEIGKFTGKW